MDTFVIDSGYSRRYFNWATYLSQTDSVAAPDNIFKVTEQAKEAEHAGRASYVFAFKSIGGSPKVSKELPFKKNNFA